MTLGWPQLVYLALLLIGVGVAAAKDGQPREAWSFWWTLVGAGLAIWLLYMGGFFTE